MEKMNKMIFQKHKKKLETKIFDRETLIPIIRSSICTGEKVAGFKNIHNGHFTDIMLIRTDADLESFLTTYGIDKEELKIEY